MLVSSFMYDANFWELNPLFTAAGPSKRLYEEDRSIARADSSRIMWFIALCYDLHPTNIFSRLEINEKHTLIGTDCMSDEDFYEKNKEILDPIIDFYCKLQDTAAKRHLRMWNLKMDEKTKYMAETPYAPETYKMIEDMMASNQKIFANLKQIEQDINKEESGTTVKGGKMPSLSDSGQI